MDILVKNVDIITADDDCKFIRNGNIGIKGGLIEFADDNPENVRHFKPEKIIDGKDRLVIPGLVNAHTHCAMTLLRNFADDQALEEWLFKKIFPAEAQIGPEEVYWGTLMGIAEMLKSGTTSFADMYLYMNSVAKAVEESGIRANLSISPLKFNAGPNSETVDEGQSCIDFYKNWNKRSNGRIKADIEVHSAYLFNEEQLKNAALLAKSLGTGIQIHILETVHEREESIRRYGMDSAEVCEKCGIFDVPVIAAHCVHLSKSDFEIFREKGVSVAHNPTSNLKLGSGIARVPHMLEYGINVCLGTDGTASNNNLNMFEEMHLAALIHKGVERNPTLVSAWQSIKMATINGAKALNIGSEVGTIRKGMKADLVILDTDKAHFTPMNNPVSAVVYCAQASDVDTVIVDGNILLENRELKTIDEELVKHKARKISSGIHK